MYLVSRLSDRVILELQVSDATYTIPGDLAQTTPPIVKYHRQLVT